MITFTLPLPPSVNECWFNLPKGRARTKKYNHWINDAWGYWLTQGKPKIPPGNYELEIAVPETMRGDASNRIKPVEDFLVKVGATSDDNLNWKPSAPREAGIRDGFCEVRIKTLEVATGREEYEEGLRAIRERVASGGDGWKLKERDAS